MFDLQSLRLKFSKTVNITYKHNNKKVENILHFIIDVLDASDLTRQLLGHISYSSIEDSR